MDFKNKLNFTLAVKKTLYTVYLRFFVLYTRLGQEFWREQDRHDIWRELDRQDDWRELDGQDVWTWREQEIISVSGRRNV